MREKLTKLERPCLYWNNDTWIARKEKNEAKPKLSNYPNLMFMLLLIGIVLMCVLTFLLADYYQSLYPDASAFEAIVASTIVLVGLILTPLLVIGIIVVIVFGVKDAVSYCKDVKEWKERR